MAPGVEEELEKTKKELQEAKDQIALLQGKNEKLKQSVVDLQKHAEEEEEYISNKLLKRIDELKAEKEKLLLEVEREEEYLTNTLQKQLEQAQKEKVMIESSFEREQEHLVNKLRKEIKKLGSGRERSLSDPSEMRALTELKKRVEELEELNRKLRLELEAEKGKNILLGSQIEVLKATNVKIHTNAEKHEEYISNTLLRRISDLKKEKEVLMVQVEVEEEYLTNMLNKKVMKLLEEKQTLEAALQAGQSTMVDHLQKRLDIVRSNSPMVENSYLRPSDLTDPEKLKNALDDLEEKFHQAQLQLNLREEKYKQIQKQNKDLKNENLLLKQRNQWEHERLESIEQEKVRLEADLEISEERQFNMLSEFPSESRSRSHSASNEYLRRTTSSNSSSLSIPSPTSSPNVSPLPNASPPQWWTRRKSSRASADDIPSF